jgi:protein gp37
MPTKIEWTDETWSPITGCTPISEGCQNCYAKRMANRLKGRYGYDKDEPFRVTLHPNRLEEPLRWKKPRMIFVCSMGDLFHEDVPDDFIDQIFAVMALCTGHAFLTLTKRPERMRGYICDWQTPFRIAKAIDALIVDEQIKQLREEIRPISGYPGYFISNMGTIYSSFGSSICLHCGQPVEGYAKKKYCSKKCKQNAEFYRRTGRKPRFQPQLTPMSPDVGEQGHMRIMLYRDGQSYRELVHRLVLSTFVRNPEPGEQGCHRNGNPQINALPNLRWGTQSDNWEDRKRHGNYQSYVKIEARQVDDIKRRYFSGENISNIAKVHNICETQVCNIVKGEQWAIDTPIEWPPKNWWAGVTAENQQRADERIPMLLQIPAVKRFVSIEPMLGPVRFKTEKEMYEEAAGMGLENMFFSFNNINPNGIGLDWTICGGETGPGARPMHPDWARSLRDQCHAAGVPFFFKQWGEFAPDDMGESSDLPWVSNETDRSRDRVIDMQGLDCTNWEGPGQVKPFALMRRVGKKNAGRLLDGQEWNEYPGVAT